MRDRKRKITQVEIGHPWAEVRRSTGRAEVRHSLL